MTVPEIVRAKVRKSILNGRLKTDQQRINYNFIAEVGDLSKFGRTTRNFKYTILKHYKCFYEALILDTSRFYFKVTKKFGIHIIARRNLMFETNSKINAIIGYQCNNYHVIYIKIIKSL